MKASTSNKALFALAISLALFAVVSGIVALAGPVNPQEIQRCEQEEGPSRVQCCNELLTKCVSRCRDDVGCVGWCFHKNDECNGR